MENNQIIPQPPKKFNKLILVGVILVLCILGFIPFIEAGTVCPFLPPCYESRISIFNWIRYRDNLQPVNSDRKKVLSEFADITSWEISELSEWRAITLDASYLAKYPKANITVMSKVFNHPDTDQTFDNNEANRDEDALIEAVKSRLSANGWKFIAGSIEPGFYQDYLYEKDNKPLVFSTGTRDAVIGGMYVTLQFLK